MWSLYSWDEMESREFRGPVEMLKLQRTFVRKLVEWGHLLPGNNAERGPVMQVMFDQIPHWLIANMLVSRLTFQIGWKVERSNTKEGRDNLFLHAAERLAFA